MDTTVGIWDTLYRIEVPVVASKSLKELTTFGVHYTGIKSIDEGHRKSWYFRYASIDHMVEMFKEGVPVMVPDPKDVRAIYQAISAHIYAWEDEIRENYMLVKAPIDDLVILDQFADSIYQEGKHLRLEDKPINKLLNVLNRGHGSNHFLSTLNIVSFSPAAPVAKVEDTRPSLADFFKEASWSLGT
jgi:hypothetical protein